MASPIVASQKRAGSSVATRLAARRSVGAHRDRGNSERVRVMDRADVRGWPVAASSNSALLSRRPMITFLPSGV